MAVSLFQPEATKGCQEGKQKLRPSVQIRSPLPNIEKTNTFTGVGFFVSASYVKTPRKTVTERYGFFHLWLFIFLPFP